MQFRKVFFDHHKPSFPQSCSIIDAAQIRKRFQLVNPRIPDYLTDTGTDGSHILSDDRLRKKKLSRAKYLTDMNQIIIHIFQIVTVFVNKSKKKTIDLATKKTKC